MNKLSKKLSLRISVIILVVFSLSYILNNYFLSRYYLYKMKEKLTDISTEVKAMDFEPFISSVDFRESIIEYIESKYSVTVVYELLNQNPDSLTESLREKFMEKRINLNKFYISEHTINKIKKGQKINNLFNQGKIKSSFLVKYIKREVQNEDIVIAIGVSVVHDRDTIAIINQFSIYLILLSLTLIIILVWFFTRQIINPLEQLKRNTLNISNLVFTKVDITTGDEIEELGESINIMSEKLEKAQSDLQEKNENLKIFITNITHELKTPLALLKAYSIGIKDKLDDGTYLDVILNQVDNISDSVDNLLRLSKLEKDIIQVSVFSVDDLITRILEKYTIIINQRGFTLSIIKDDLVSPWIMADENKIEIVISNLISNAIKYAASAKIQITMKNINETVFFAISNETSIFDKNHINRIWEPFYVLESSRDKKLSGTGLGLSIVSTILKNHNIDYGFNLHENKIEFYIFFPGESWNE